MRRRFEVATEDLLESCAQSINALEAHGDSPAADRIRSLLDEACRLLNETAAPIALYASLTAVEFSSIFAGDGGNDEDTPVEQVLEEALSLALFAVTLGMEVSRRITAHFDAGEVAEGYLLDQVASFAADELAQMTARFFRAEFEEDPGKAVLPYSPGYCGWNVSGQRALFFHLKPEEIGITLNESCLMQPTKSVSGVLILAPIKAHDFSPAFPCCATCTTLDCQERIAALREPPD